MRLISLVLSVSGTFAGPVVSKFFLENSTTIIKVGGECVAQETKNPSQLVWGRCDAYDGEQLATAWVFETVEGKPYGHIKNSLKSDVYTGACWTAESDMKPGLVSLKACEDGVARQHFMISGRQLWSMVSPGPTSEKLVYCVVYEHGSVLRTRHCYQDDLMDLHTDVVISTTAAPTTTPLDKSSLFKEFVEQLSDKVNGKMHFCYPYT